MGRTTSGNVRPADYVIAAVAFTTTSLWSAVAVVS
jgi:hypothetical protein